MFYLYTILLILSPTVFAQPDPEDVYEYNWKFKDYEPNLSPTWRSRRTRVEGYPHYEERLIKDYLSQMISGRLQAAQGGAVGLTGGDGSSEDEWLPPPPRHRPQYKQQISPPPQFTYNAVHRPIEQNIPQFAVPPSDSRFFDTVDVQTLTPLVQQMSGHPSSVDLKMAVNDPPPAYHEETTENDQVYKTPLIDFNATKENMMFIALVIGCSIGALSGIALIVYGFIRLQRNAKAAADVEYPAYGVTGPNKEATPTGDRRLAHSAQMYHYQLTKQQIIAMESTRGERRGSVSEADSDDENEDGDYTVYECPGLAPTGEMEVKNPLFQDDPTPAQTNNVNNDSQPQEEQEQHQEQTDDKEQPPTDESKDDNK